MTDPEPDTAVTMLRAELLSHLNGDVVPMAHIDTLITRHHPDVSTTDRHHLAMRTIESLHRDQLILVGDVVGGDPAYIQPWPATPEQILARIHDRYVTHYTDTIGWDLSIWFTRNDNRKIFHRNTSH
jgi:hypothetical protein